MLSSNAVFSEDKKYRYTLWRAWDLTLPAVMLIGLNPSRANEIDNDPTIRRCIAFAKYWGFGQFYMTNLFAYIATKPKDLKLETNPIGTENDYWLKEIQGRTNLTVFVWGTNGNYLNRDKEVGLLIESPHCISISKHGFPNHPLYLKNTLKPVPFNFPL